MTHAEAERVLGLARTADPQLHGIVELALVLGIPPYEMPPITPEVLGTRRVRVSEGQTLVLGTVSYPIAARLNLPFGAPGQPLLDARWRRLARRLSIATDGIDDVRVLMFDREIDVPLGASNPPADFDDDVPF